MNAGPTGGRPVVRRPGPGAGNGTKAQGTAGGEGRTGEREGAPVTRCAGCRPDAIAADAGDVCAMTVMTGGAAAAVMSPLKGASPPGPARAAGLPFDLFHTTIPDGLKGKPSNSSNRVWLKFLVGKSRCVSVVIERSIGSRKCMYPYDAP